MRNRWATMVVMGTSTATSSVAAQPCTLPPALAAWARPTTPAPASPLMVGTAATLALTAAPAFAPAPAKPPVSGSTGLVVSIDITRPGTYRVAIGTPAWIDLVKDGKPLASSAHAHGEACTGIAKMVDFALVPGRYTLQISGAHVATTELLVARLP